jgi:K+-transporting ATPase ATPase C chain
MNLRRNALTAALVMVLLTVVLGLAYPLAITGISQVVFPGNANGQKLYRDGTLVGSRIIGENFGTVVLGKNGKPEMQNGNPVTAPDPRYFQTRPSATVPADNAAATTFSNLGPNNATTLTAFQGYIQTYLGLNLGPNNKPYDPAVTKASQIPVDAVSDSASSIDPDISVANAKIQAYRIAAVRHLSLARVDALVSTYTTSRSLGFLGEPVVDVLNINLALDRISGSK